MRTHSTHTHTVNVWGWSALCQPRGSLSYEKKWAEKRDSHKTSPGEDIAAAEALKRHHVCHSPDDGERWQLLQVKREIHTKVCPEQSRDGDWREKERRRAGIKPWTSGGTCRTEKVQKHGVGSACYGPVLRRGVTLWENADSEKCQKIFL